MLWLDESDAGRNFSGTEFSEKSSAGIKTSKVSDFLFLGP
jgi:hypothetical protein